MTHLLKLPNFDGKVTVIGDVMLDRYWYGSSTRISPEAPVPVVNVNNFEERAGGAANVAINLASLGVPCDLVGVVGKDEPATLLANILHNHKVDTAFIECDDLPTITKLRVLSRHQQLIRIDFEKDYSNLDHGRILQELRRCMRDTKVIICSDYGKGTLSSIQNMIQAARLEQIPVLIDPKGSDFSKYKGATLLTPNMSEFEAVVGKVKDNHDLEEKALKLINQLSLDALLITRSEDGMSLVVPGQSTVHIPTFARDVYDVTGAGDTVIATLGACLASGVSLVDSCAIANRAAGIVVGKLGTSTVSIPELQKELEVKQSSVSLEKGVVSQDALVNIVNLLKEDKQKIVMTNGCFDILHRGHVDYLKKARSLGDILIVAVNSDESVQKLKGPTRPIVTLENRMEVLASLGCVDYVVPFSEETPQSLIARILPDILVKGGDYKVEEIAGHKEVLANGGEVKVLHFVDNCSTTSIVNKIKDNN